MARINKGGRPARHKGERLVKHRTFRVRGRLDEMLEEAAAQAGRSVSEQIERMLEDAFFQDRLNANILGSNVAGEILRLIRAAMVVEGLVGVDWDRNLTRAENLRTAANAIIATVTQLPVELPPPEQRLEGYRTAKALLMTSSPKRTLPPELEVGEEGHPTRRKVG
jgi:hypothetical protein